jgi:hypothetical protein
MSAVKELHPHSGIFFVVLFNAHVPGKTLFVDRDFDSSRTSDSFLQDVGDVSFNKLLIGNSSTSKDTKFFISL